MSDVGYVIVAYGATIGLYGFYIWRLSVRARRAAGPGRELP